ncbi:hypothetical protein BTRA_3085 [Burkholderia thailandensis USAMRU Malaysia |uniref:hypothetical protein n=1 Tax=Burkholderia thailandensis TaxID=57975 RepID=UPI0003EC793B|nr:hypothetical protein [Burkholderia thailandensis]AHI80403.1 hypothetical protein BTJ_1492 [Burkholderia thailandensis E444]AIC87346.1 hypothetical protein BTRA_3085 [Burkholderia thailandensis USAMRU Malaysia \
MAETNSVQMAKVLGAPNAKLQPNETGGRSRIMFGQVTSVAGAINDTIYFGRIPGGSRITGVTINNAAGNGVNITMYRDVSIKRDTDYQDNGDLLAGDVNADFDRLWMAMQDGNAGLNRSASGMGRTCACATRNASTATNAPTNKGSDAPNLACMAFLLFVRLIEKCMPTGLISLRSKDSVAKRCFRDSTNCSKTSQK